MRVVGIDIGTFSIKLAELEASGNTSTIVRLDEFPLSQKPGADYELDVITTLRQVLSTYQNDSKVQFVLGLKQSDVSVRSLFFPFKERFKILKSLPFELEDEIPFHAHECIFDGKIIKNSNLGSHVLALATRKESIKKCIELCKDVQIEPSIISLDTLALNNLFENISTPPPLENTNLDEEEDLDEEDEKSKKYTISENLEYQQGEAVLSIGHTSSLLVVRSGGTLKAITQIEWGGKNLIAALAQKKGIQENEAFEMLAASNGILLNKEHGSEEEWEFSQILSRELVEFGHNIGLTLLEIKGSHLVEVQGIGLLGGTSAVRNIGAKITQGTGIPCNKIVQIKNYPGIDFKTNQHKELSMGVALGLAIEAIRKPSNPAVNFRKEEFAKEYTHFKDFWKQWGFYISLSALSITLFFVYATIRNTWTEELSLVAKTKMKNSASKIINIPSKQVTEVKLAKFLSSIEKRTKAKEKINSINTDKSALYTLSEISKRSLDQASFPVDINEFNILGRKVTIDGKTSSSRNLDSFITRLKKVAKGGKVLKTNSSKPTEPGFKGFRLTFTATTKP